MMTLDDYAEFRQHIEKLKMLSLDDSSPSNPQYMTDSEKTAVDFDMVKRCYANRFGVSEDRICSVDGLFSAENSLVFVEFKNGAVERRNVKDKIRDSLLIFCDITHETISFTRQNVEFVLVYNEEKNPLPNQYTKGIQASGSRRYISKRLAQMGGTEIVLFDLDRYNTLYFKKVHTYSQEEFEIFLSAMSH